MHILLIFALLSLKALHVSLHSLECLLYLKAVLRIINVRKSQASCSSSSQLHLIYYIQFKHDVSYPTHYEVPQH